MLRVELERPEQWLAFRGDCVLMRNGRSATFSTSEEARRLADVHYRDGYPNSGFIFDGFAWLPDPDPWWSYPGRVLALRGMLVAQSCLRPACPRCKRATEVREHTVIGEKQLRAPFYYSRWYRCTNTECRTTLVMPDEFKVYRDSREIWGETWDDGGLAKAAIEGRGASLRPERP